MKQALWGILCFIVISVYIIISKVTFCSFFSYSCQSDGGKRQTVQLQGSKMLCLAVWGAVSNTMEKKAYTGLILSISGGISLLLCRVLGVLGKPNKLYGRRVDHINGDCIAHPSCNYWGMCAYNHPCTPGFEPRVYNTLDSMSRKLIFHDT